METIRFDKINLKDLDKIEISREIGCNVNYEFIPAKQLNGFFKFLNPILVGDRILDKNTKTVEEIRFRYEEDKKYFINPFDGKWYRSKYSSIIIRVPYIRLIYKNRSIKSYLGFDEKIMNEFYKTIKEYIDKEGDLFFNLENGWKL